MVKKKKDDFPGFKACIQMMRKRNDGQMREDGFHWLLPRVDDYIDDVIAEFEKPENEGIRGWLLELLGYSKSPTALTVLAKELRNENEALRNWAIYGLKRIGNKDALQLLWDARYYDLASPEATQNLHQQMDHVIGKEQAWEKYHRHSPMNTSIDDS